jgi:hypothetical protein
MRAEVMAQMVECLLSKNEVLSSNSSTVKKEKEREQWAVKHGGTHL